MASGPDAPTDAEQETTTPALLHVSKSPHLANELSFDIDRYDHGAKALFAFFIIGIIASVLAAAFIVDRRMFCPRTADSEEKRRRSLVALAFGTLLLAVLTFSLYCSPSN